MDKAQHLTNKSMLRRNTFFHFPSYTFYHKPALYPVRMRLILNFKSLFRISSFPLPILIIPVPKSSILFMTHFSQKVSRKSYPILSSNKCLYFKESNCCKSFFSLQIGKNCVLHLFVYTPITAKTFKAVVS